VQRINKEKHKKAGGSVANLFTWSEKKQKLCVIPTGGHNKKYSCLQETTNLISYNEDVLALRIKISSLRTIFVTREDKDESPGRTRASHPGGQK
jgi:hypothetical protein